MPTTTPRTESPENDASPNAVNRDELVSALRELSSLVTMSDLAFSQANVRAKSILTVMKAGHTAGPIPSKKTRIMKHAVFIGGAFLLVLSGNMLAHQQEAVAITATLFAGIYFVRWGSKKTSIKTNRD